METNPDLHNPLYGKTILWNGDSICAGSDLCGSWATRIARRNAMSGKNYAIGGGTITGNPPPMRKSGKQRHSVCETLDTMYVEFPDADYIILEGGTNDADLMGNALTDPSQTRLGTFQPLDFSGSYDTDLPYPALLEREKGRLCGGAENGSESPKSPEPPPVF